MLTEQDIQKQRQLNLLDNDLPALRCLNQDYKGDLSNLLFDLDYYAKLPEAQRAFNALDTVEFTVIHNETIDWQVEKIRNELDRLNDEIEGELDSIINDLEQDNPDLDQIIGYLKHLHKSNEGAFNKVDKQLDKLFKTDD